MPPYEQSFNSSVYVKFNLVFLTVHVPRGPRFLTKGRVTNYLLRNAIPGFGEFRFLMILIPVDSNNLIVHEKEYIIFDSPMTLRN
jgi:hypothetical protein